MIKVCTWNYFSNTAPIFCRKMSRDNLGQPLWYPNRMFQWFCCFVVSLQLIYLNEISSLKIISFSADDDRERGVPLPAEADAAGGHDWHLGGSGAHSFLWPHHWWPAVAWPQFLRHGNVALCDVSCGSCSHFPPLILPPPGFCSRTGIKYPQNLSSPPSFLPPSFFFASCKYSV